MKKSSRMKEKTVTLLFLVSLVASLDYHNLQVDEISGELLKPSNWSDAKFLTVQQLRLSVRNYSMLVLCFSKVYVTSGFCFLPIPVQWKIIALHFKPSVYLNVNNFSGIDESFSE